MCSWHWGPGRGGGMRTDLAGDATGRRGVQTNRGRSSTSGHTQGSQSQTSSTHLGPWASTASLLSSPRPSPTRKAAGKQNSKPLGTDSYSQWTTATTHDDCAIVTDGER